MAAFAAFFLTKATKYKTRYIRMVEASIAMPMLVMLVSLLNRPRMRRTAPAIKIMTDKKARSKLKSANKGSRFASSFCLSLILKNACTPLTRMLI